MKCKICGEEYTEEELINGICDMCRETDNNLVFDKFVGNQLT